MKNFLVIITLIASLILLNSCAKPTVVSIVDPEDEKLNCDQLETAILEAQKIKKEAEYAQGATGGNVTRMMLFWPAWAKTLHNADKAISAADDRTYHLYKIMKTRNCEESSKVRYFVTDRRKNFIGLSKELKELKKLYKSGDLTEEEYVKAKKKVLE